MSHVDAKVILPVDGPNNRSFIDGLCDPAAYPGIETDSVQRKETHISWIFLVGDFAFKLKKPIRTTFLDYSTLEKRKYFCDEELRLDRRYAAHLYLGVVPISMSGDGPIVQGDGRPVEWAVKMRRFPDDALLSEQLHRGLLSTRDVEALAGRIADFHQAAPRLNLRSDRGARLGTIDGVYRNATENLRELRDAVGGASAATLGLLCDWTRTYFDQHRRVLLQRVANGFIRECHGDLHLENIVRWQGELLPFDGIEFNEEFRWIDVISDAAFVAMDFAARERLDLSRTFINAYLERTGDHASLAVLRWYLVYRALIRAKVAAIRFAQTGPASSDVSDTMRAAARKDCHRHIELAERFSRRDRPAVWITHGVSGSGKTTVSELAIQRRGAIRLRSDIERKRHYGMSPTDRPDRRQKAELYSDCANRATYARLRRIARCILRSGFPVVIDATFLRREERQLFQSLAAREGATFGILDCQADMQTLRQRITDRMARDSDASDADLDVLESQLACHQPLTAAERPHVVAIHEDEAPVGNLPSHRANP
jgi:aminoglycoside phosphotransferase family enzyme/predicted kinase